jgi:hypothetical protein
MNERRHPRALQIVVSAWLAIAAWVAIALFLVLVLLEQLQSLRGSWSIDASVAIALIASFCCFAAAYIALAVSLRCQACGKRLFVETFSPAHPRASRVWGMNHWASCLVHIVRHGQCNCMHCGSLVTVTND